MTSENQPRIEELHAEIASIKKDLDKINDVKEQWYSKKEKISEEIRTRIDSIKGSKEARNVKTAEVRKAKDARDQLNKKIKVIVDELKAFNDKKREVLDKSGLRDPERARKQIQALETKLETEVMSFDKEKGLNKQIKDLKKQLEGSAASGNLNAEINKKREELRIIRKEAKEKHAVVQKSASDSQENHVALLSHSKEVDELRKKEEEAFKEFLKHKEDFTQRNDKLKELVAELNELTKGEKDDARAKDAKRKEKDEVTLKEKGKSVEEKIKKKQKLTTEDLLIFQKS